MKHFNFQIKNPGCQPGFLVEFTPPILIFAVLVTLLVFVVLVELFVLL
jgi:hypothetical protein